VSGQWSQPPRPTPIHEIQPGLFPRTPRHRHTIRSLPTPELLNVRLKCLHVKRAVVSQSHPLKRGTDR
jgi:hypothetical protein